MDTYSLIEVTSPTKGKLKISYEPHQFTVKGKNLIGGGLRVKSTELYDPISARTIVKDMHMKMRILWVMIIQMKRV